jgi:orotate phosphoribosyltransferase
MSPFYFDCKKVPLDPEGQYLIENLFIEALGDLQVEGMGGHTPGPTLGGNVKAGDRVVVLDDVVTTGASTLQAISACRKADFEILGALALVDRQELNGRENIEREVPFLKALVTCDEVMR